MPSFHCKACDGHGFVMVHAHGPQELKCEDCGGTGEIEVEPDAHCVTTVTKEIDFLRKGVM